MKLLHGHVQLPCDDEQLARLEAADPGLNLRAHAGSQRSGNCCVEGARPNCLRLLRHDRKLCATDKDASVADVSIGFS